MISSDHRLHIGTLVYNGIDQIDVTEPFEVLSRLPNTSHLLYELDATPAQDGYADQ